MRLERYLANATGLSRSEVQRYIRNGAVRVDGDCGSVGQQVTHAQCVELEGNRISLPEPLYLMLHKPAGCICATTDSQHPTVLDFVQGNPLAKHPTESLQIVGRLDLDTTGLLLLTTDGHWNHLITAPASRCEKTYRVTLAEPLSNAAISELEHGLILRSDAKPTQTCVITRINPLEVKICLMEGRYHQVKRMFAAVNNRVVALHRESIGAIALDQTLKPGAFRPLTSEEVQSVY